MLVAIDGKPAGLVSVSDPIKESTTEAIRELQSSRPQDHHGHRR